MAWIKRVYYQSEPQAMLSSLLSVENLVGSSNLPMDMVIPGFGEEEAKTNRQVWLHKEAHPAKMKSDWQK